MSAEERGRGFNPTPRVRPTRFTGEDVRFFKELFAEHPLIRWAIYASGFGGALDGMSVLWHCAKFLAGMGH